jgi:hypothetical protein
MGLHMARMSSRVCEVTYEESSILFGVLLIVLFVPLALSAQEQLESQKITVKKRLTTVS